MVASFSYPKQIYSALKTQYTFPTDDKINIWMLDRFEWQKA